MTGSDFREVTRDKPCEICHKLDWCRRSDDGCIECHRHTDDVPGFNRLKVTASRFGLYRPAAQRTPNHARKPVAISPQVSAIACNAPDVTVDTPKNEIDAPSPPQSDPGAKSATFPTVEAFAASLGDRHGGTWIYQNADSSPAMAVVRVNESDGSKRFIPLHPTADGWAIGDPPGPLPLYGLTDLDCAGLVCVVEGEKCVEAARSIGLVATTSSHGASSPGKTDWTPLGGRDVVILPDADKPGHSYAESVARILTGLHTSARVKIVGLPGLSEKSDIVDWLAIHECTDLDDLRRIIGELTDAAPWYVPAENVQPTDSLPADAGPLWVTVAEVGTLPTYRQGLQPLTTGYACLDAALRGGFRPECMYTVAARTGSAKTTLALNVARRDALSGHSVLVFKLEESVTEATWRMHAAASQVDFRLLLDGTSSATHDDRKKLIDGWSLIRSLPIRLSACRDLPGIQRIARAHVEQGGKLIILDQLSMIRVEGAEVGYTQATTASNALRLLAVELRVPVVLVCQVNRPAAKNDKEHLSCHDLRDSGAIENDSAAVILIDKVREPDHAWRAAEPVRYLDLIIGKNRYGPTTDPEKPLTLTWWPRWCRIEESPGGSKTEGAA